MASVTDTVNPLLALDLEPALENLGGEYYDPVTAATFPEHSLRFRNDDILGQLGLAPQQVSDRNFVEAFGQFKKGAPLLALRYHGYQFGAYNSNLGDGRGFLYGQVRDQAGILRDLGTKGSGTTPYSRGGDGRLTLKGGVREVLASEALHALGVNTSRTLSLVETGEQLERGDEPSPTRSSVMVRYSQSHIRFGTFERLHHLERSDLIEKLLDHVVAVYYTHLLDLPDKQERYARFYGELAQRIAVLAAQWMAAGFCHAVLNTDNMSITGESFDYGPYAFMQAYGRRFTAAYFDYGGRYSYGNQPGICQLNLELLQRPLGMVMSAKDLEAGLAPFAEHYRSAYEALMLRKLGFETYREERGELLFKTLQMMEQTHVDYHGFFLSLTEQFLPTWKESDENILQATMENSDDAAANLLGDWRQQYHYCLQEFSEEELRQVGLRLRQRNPAIVLHRPRIEAIWEPITEDDNWAPFYALITQIQRPFLAEPS
ncbi:MAG: YdiU family protein [Cyanobacteria bacterium J06632_22]